MKEIEKHIRETIALLGAYITRDAANLSDCLLNDVVALRSRIDANKVVVMYLNEVLSMFTK